MNLPSLLLVFFLLSVFRSESQSLYFPPVGGDQWEKTDPKELFWDTVAVDSLIAFVERSNSKGFIILVDGKIVIEEYMNGHTLDKNWYWASAAKSLVAFLVGLAQQDSLLHIEDRVSDYLGEGWTSASLEQESQIKVRNQISMNTGLDDTVEDIVAGEGFCRDPACLKYLTDPGDRWAYFNAPYQLVQDVLESAHGQNKNSITRMLGDRIGMGGFWLDYLFFSTTRDMARFGLLALNKGVWGQDTLLSDQDYFLQMVNSSQDINLSYGFLWWLNGKESHMIPELQIVFPGPFIPEAPDDLFAALGKDDQKIYVVPSEHMVVVRQGESAGPIAPAPSSFDRELWARISSIIDKATHTRQARSIPAWQVWPNPAREEIQVVLPVARGELLLFDGQGRLLLQKKVRDHSVLIPIFQFPPGPKILKWKDRNNLYTKRLVKH